MEMVQAFEILKKNGVDATLVLLGDGPVKEKIWKHIQTKGLEEVVMLRGPVDYIEVPDYIGACDAGILALPDHIWWRYQCPTKILECLAMNKPLIISDIPAHKWIVDNAPLALYLKGTCPKDIAIGIQAFIASQDAFQSNLGRKIAVKFSMGEIAHMLERQILSVNATESAKNNGNRTKQ